MRFARQWRLAADGDALDGGAGRAEEVAVERLHDPSDVWLLAVGCRYAFAWLH